MEKLKTYQIVIFFATILLLIAFIIYVVSTFNNPDTQVNASADDIMSDEQPNTSIDDSSETLIPQPPTPPSSDLNYVAPPPFDRSELDYIDAIIRSKGEGISVYYEDINSGNSYTFNGEQKYFIASVVKAPYCMYIYDLASRGELDLTDKYKFTKKDIQEGSGKLKETEFLTDAETGEEIPAELTVRELLSYAILYSDNTAIELLRKNFNHVGYTKYAMGLGLQNKDDIKQIVNSDITAVETGIYAKALYEFFYTNAYGEELKSDMMKTRNKMIVSQYPMARKYGWAEKAFHDMAIVYAPNPYILVILSDKGEGKGEDFKAFAEISTLFAGLHQDKYDSMN